MTEQARTGTNMATKIGMPSADRPATFPPPWGMEVKVMTIGGTFVCLGLPFWFQQRSPPQTDPPAAGLLYAPVLMWLLCYLGSIRGYFLTGDTLFIHRLIWSTRIPPEGLVSIDTRTNPFRSTVGLVGNPGIFGICGFFYNRKVGRFRAWVTSKSDTCVLRFAHRAIAISPGQQRRFLTELLKLVEL